MASRCGYIHMAFAACFQWSHFGFCSWPAAMRRIKGKWWLGTLSPQTNLSGPDGSEKKGVAGPELLGRLIILAAQRFVTSGVRSTVKACEPCQQAGTAQLSWSLLEPPGAAGAELQGAAALLCSAGLRQWSWRWSRTVKLRAFPADLGLLHFSCHPDLVLLMRPLTEGKGKC